MATDDYGLHIPVPDSSTEDYELRPLLRDALNTVARLLSEIPAPAAAPTSGLRPAVADLTAQLGTLAEQLDADRQATARLGSQLSQDLTAQLGTLAEQLDADRQATARLGSLLSNFAGQLETLQTGLDNERQARIAAAADLHSKLTADIKLAQLERLT